MSHSSRAPTHPVQLSDVMFGGYLTFLLVGAASMLYGPALVFIAAETGQPVATLGVLFALHWLGYLAGTLVGNPIARHLEIRRAVIIGSLLTTLGAAGFILLPFPFNLGSALLIGLGLGTLEVLLNRVTEFLAADAPAAAMSRLHATVGVGAVIMPLVVATVTWFGLNWRVAGAVLVGFAVCNVLVTLRWREFTVPHSADIVWRNLPWRSILLFALMCAVYVGAETSVGGWATTFFAKLGQGPFLGAIATSLFFVTFTVGRIAFASVPERLGYARTVRLGSVLAGATLMLTLEPGLALVGFSLAGIAFSVIFPTLLVWGPRQHPEIRAQLAMLAIASASAGGVVIPPLVGAAVGTFGAPSLPPILVAVTLLVGLLALFEPGLEAAAKRRQAPAE